MFETTLPEIGGLSRGPFDMLFKLDGAGSILYSKIEIRVALSGISPIGEAPAFCVQLTYLFSVCNDWQGKCNHEYCIEDFSRKLVLREKFSGALQMLAEAESSIGLLLTIGEPRSNVLSHLVHERYRKIIISRDVIFAGQEQSPDRSWGNPQLRIRSH
jgi:hypothetical protein